MSTNIERTVSSAPVYDPLFEDANDQHLRGVKIYTSTTVGDAYAYADSECTITFTAEQLRNLFLIKGAVIVDDGVYYKPVSMAVSPTATVLVYVKTNDEDISTARLDRILAREPA